MNPRHLSRIISALVLGVLLGVIMYFDFAKYQKMSREDFLVMQGERYEKTFSRPQPLALLVVVAAIMAGIGFGFYELLASGIYHLLRLRYQKATADPDNSEMLGS